MIDHSTMTPAKEVVTYLCFESAVHRSLLVNYNIDLIEKHANRSRLSLYFNTGESVTSAIETLEVIINQDELNNKWTNPLKGAHFAGYKEI